MLVYYESFTLDLCLMFVQYLQTLYTCINVGFNVVLRTSAVYLTNPGLIQIMWTFISLFFSLKVVEQGMFVKHCKVEVYLTELKLCEDSNMDNVITRRFSKADTIGRPESLWSNCLLTLLLILKSTWRPVRCHILSLDFHCFAFIL